MVVEAGTNPLNGPPTSTEFARSCLFLCTSTKKNSLSGVIAPPTFPPYIWRPQSWLCPPGRLAESTSPLR